MVEYTYDSWGKSISVTGTLATTLGADQPFRYRSYMYDTETGFYYLKSRYYDPAVCRFISSDVFFSTGQGVLGNNSYAYCNNNAINCADSSGHAAYFNNVMYVCDGGCNSSNKGIQTNTTGKKVDKPTVLIGGLNIKSQRYKKLKKFFSDDFTSEDSHYLINADVKYIGRRNHENSPLDTLVTLGGSSNVVGAASGFATRFFPKLTPVLGPLGDVCSAVGIAALIAEPPLISNGTYDYYTINLSVFEKNSCYTDYVLSQKNELTFFWYDAYDNNSFWVTD